MFNLEIPMFAIRNGSGSGLASSIYNLVRGLAALGKKVRLPYTTKHRLDAQFVSWSETNEYVEFRKCPAVPGGVQTRFVEEFLYANMRKKGAQVLYPNYFMPPELFRRNDAISVIIHDCQHRMFPNYFSSRKRRWLDLNFHRSLKRADHVFLISEFEKSQIARYYGESLANRCSVIYNSIDWSRYECGTPSEDVLKMTSKPYILSVAHQYPHKNTLKLIKSYLNLSERYADFDLILVGTPSNEVSEFLDSCVPEKQRQKIILAGFVSDADLGRLYRYARLFVLASSYEGFGMPAVEAAGFAVPVLVTNGTALPEVTLGRAAYCADDASPQAWAEAISQHLDHKRSAEEYRTLADAVRKRFAPTAVATALLRESASA